ncbi:MAG: CoA-binding protein [Proteobacteria bacterium]|nr:CoA-binding protein [Pseudomonadota bacterium]MBU1688152.1 CoA-binding protein [Pseudomonadota bacterium]
MISLEIQKVLQDFRTIAVVGLSPKENRPSNQVARYLLAAGYTIFPVNPGQREILGLPCYGSLEEIPTPVDIVDIFRRPEDIPPIVESAISVGAKVIWMQLGIVHDQAAARAEASGLTVIMDRCIAIDHQNLAKL